MSEVIDLNASREANLSTAGVFRMLADAIEDGTNTTDYVLLTLNGNGCSYGLSTEYENTGYFNLLGALTAVTTNFATEMEKD